MAELQELPPSSALPQVQLTMELMGQGQWQRGNTNSCFMSCTMLTHARAEFSLEQGQQQIFIWQMLSHAILQSTLCLCRAAAGGSSDFGTLHFGNSTKPGKAVSKTLFPRPSLLPANQIKCIHICIPQWLYGQA